MGTTSLHFFRSRFESQFCHEHGAHVPVEQNSTLLTQHRCKQLHSLLHLYATLAEVKVSVEKPSSTLFSREMLHFKEVTENREDDCTRMEYGLFHADAVSVDFWDQYILPYSLACCLLTHYPYNPLDSPLRLSHSVLTLSTETYHSVSPSLPPPFSFTPLPRSVGVQQHPREFDDFKAPFKA